MIICESFNEAVLVVLAFDQTSTCVSWTLNPESMKGTTDIEEVSMTWSSASISTNRVWRDMVLYGGTL